MAKKTSNELLSQDFTADMQKYIQTPTGSSVWEKQAALFRQEAMMPFMSGFDAALDNVWTALREKDRQRIEKLGILKSATTDWDEDAMIYSGMEDIIGPELKRISADQHLLTQKLSMMNIDHPDYDATMKQFEKNNKAVSKLQAINQKLLDLKNGDIDVEDIDFDVLSETESEMWTDVLSGNKENFVFVDGQLFWKNPEGGQMMDPTKTVEFDKKDTRDKLEIINNPDVAYLDSLDVYGKWSGYINEEVGKGTFNPDKESTTKVQQALVNLGYDLGNTGPKGDGVDGNYGGKTEKAYQLFSKSVFGRTPDNNIQKLIDDYKGTLIIADPTYSPETHGSDWINMANIDAIGPSSRLENIGIASEFHNEAEGTFQTEIAPYAMQGVVWSTGVDSRGVDIGGVQGILQSRLSAYYKEAGSSGITAMIFNPDVALAMDGFDQFGLQKEWLHAKGITNPTEDDIDNMRKAGLNDTAEIDGKEVRLIDFFKQKHKDHIKFLYENVRKNSTPNIEKSDFQTWATSPSVLKKYGPKPSGFTDATRIKGDLTGGHLNMLWKMLEYGEVASGTLGTYTRVNEGINKGLWQHEDGNLLSGKQLVNLFSEKSGLGKGWLINQPAFLKFATELTKKQKKYYADLAKKINPKKWMKK